MKSIISLLFYKLDKLSLVFVLLLVIFITISFILVTYLMQKKKQNDHASFRVKVFQKQP